jgi:pyruvate dehydrogenase E2 component (dihydrolipoamide acetyltransferase)
MIKINMPVIGQDIPTGIVLEWLKKEGDPIEKDEVIAAVQSEKADFDVEAPASGILVKILKKAGEEAEVLTPIGYIGEPGEVYEEPVQKGEEPNIAKEESTPAPAFTESGENVKQPKKDKMIASPLARRVAREAGISLEMIKGTGPNGRIIKKNVLASIYSADSLAQKYDSDREPVRSVQKTTQILSVEEGDQKESFSRIRQLIADRMTQSTRNIPHFYLNADVPMDQVANWRLSTNNAFNAKITFTDIIVHAVASALREFPRLNAHAGDAEIVYKKRINIGVAVSSDEGLLVPVIPDADQKDILSISNEIKAKSVLARDGKLDLSTRGTFTISSLGMYGITSFQPIINPPETGILAIGKIEDRLVADDKTMKFMKMMTVTLACDHRAVDGSYGAEFLKRLSKIMEEANFRTAKW